MNAAPSRAAAWQCPPRTILVGVDFGEASARALAIAAVLASAFKAKLRALHAERFEPPPYFTPEQIERLESERRSAQAAAADHVTRFAAAASGTVEPIVLDEPPIDAILDSAAGTDLIILGTHGRRGPGRWWLGSVAERVVRAAGVPVLVARAEDAPPRSVFERVTIVRDGQHEDPAARACATRLAEIGSGRVIDGGVVSDCEPRVLQQASLVVMSIRHERTEWGLTDRVTKILGSCSRPVLFVPAG